MELEQEELRTAAFLGALLAGFFAAGFIASSSFDTGTSTQAVVQDNGSTPASATQEEVIQRGMQTLRSGPLSYPFTYNVSTRSVNRHRFGGTYFYNWTVSYVVEPNPFQSPIYQVPGNQTSATKTLTLYLSRDGDYMFQSPPIRTASGGGQQQTSGPAYP